MAYAANILNMMIASPSDVANERTIVTDAILQWNAANGGARQLFLQPLKWETHASPQLGVPPQQSINDQLLLEADIVVGIFGTRVGTATPEFRSGSIEEIKKHTAAGKLVMLYFSKIPVDPNTIDAKQWQDLQNFKNECRQVGLYSEFDSYDELRSDFIHHLSIELNRPKYLWLSAPKNKVSETEPALTVNDVKLIIAMAADRNGTALVGSTMSGFFVQANDLNFVESSPRSEAQWRKVITRLGEFGYIEKTGESVYSLTEDGYDRAEREENKFPLSLETQMSGSVDKPSLLVSTNKAIEVTGIEFLTSQDVRVSDMKLNCSVIAKGEFQLNYDKIHELVNAPRPDRTPDYAGPAKIRLRFKLRDRDRHVTLPILLNQRFLNNTQWFELTGAQAFELEP